jgi:ribonuclease D
VSNWIRTPDDLGHLVASLQGCRALALDSESDSLYHHYEKVCLIQLATEDGHAYLIDTLALPDLSPLKSVLADPGVVKVFHGADYDVTTLKRDFSFGFENIFDTMIAARFLGAPEIGLQALALSELGVALSKANQRDDWSKRPLTPIQEAYAQADVEHLLSIYARLLARLRDSGRLEWALEECQAVAALEPARRRDDREAYQRVKGARRLSLRSLAALGELYGWRDALARRSDTPSFRILTNEVLLTLAEKRPRTQKELGQVRGVLPRLAGESASILDALDRARRLSEDALPRIAVVARPVVSEPTRRRIEALKAFRTREAARFGLDGSILLPQRLIDRLAEAAPRGREDLEAIEGLRRWRVDALGDRLLEALRSV